MPQASLVDSQRWLGHRHGGLRHGVRGSRGVVLPMAGNEGTANGNGRVMAKHGTQNGRNPPAAVMSHIGLDPLAIGMTLGGLHPLVGTLEP